MTGLNTPAGAGTALCTNSSSANQPLDTLKQLHSLLSGLQPAKGSPSPEAWDLVLDLQGQTLCHASTSECPNISVQKGARVHIHNGTLDLPADCCVTVGPTSVLQLDCVHIIGPGATKGKAGQALVVASGAGAQLKTSACSVTQTDASRQSGCAPDCVLVYGSASAALDDCYLVDAQGSGLLVNGVGTTATVSRSQATGCLYGFVSTMGGRASISSSVAVSSRGSGFAAYGPGTEMLVGPECTARSNAAHGFLSFRGAIMTVGQGCAAAQNDKCGFVATELGTAMRVEKGCTAYGNKQSGFWASYSAHMKVVAEATAHNNHFCGFSCSHGSCLEAGPGCEAYGNQKVGFFVHEGGSMTIEGGAEASANVYSGFNADGPSSLLLAGPGCTATGNKQHGFHADHGGHVKLAGQAEACANQLSGFCSENPGSHVATGPDCTSHSNGKHGFAAVDAGHLSVGPSSQAAGNRRCGVLSSDSGSVAELSRGCSAKSNSWGGIIFWKSGSLIEVESDWNTWDSPWDIL